MTELIYLFIINTLFIYGVNVVTRENMIFGWIACKLRNLIGVFISKPLMDCPPCMASFWGIAFFVPFALVTYPAVYLLALPVYVFSLSGFVFLIGQMMPCCDG